MERSDSAAERGKHASDFVDLLNAEVVFCWGRDAEERPILCFPSCRASAEQYARLAETVAYLKHLFEQDIACQQLGIAGLINARDASVEEFEQLLQALVAAQDSWGEHSILYILCNPEKQQAFEGLAAATSVTVKKMACSEDELEGVVAANERTKLFGGPETAVYSPADWIACHEPTDTAWLQCHQLFMHAMASYKAHAEGRLHKFEVEEVLPEEQVAKLVADGDSFSKKAVSAAMAIPAAGLHSHEQSLVRLQHSISAVQELRQQLESVMHKIRLRCFVNEVVTWAVLCMHYLANEAAPCDSAPDQLRSQLSDLEVLHSQRPPAVNGDETETWKELSENFEDLSDDLARGIVEQASTSLQVRQGMVSRRKDAEVDGGTQSQFEVDVCESSEEEMGVEEASASKAEDELPVNSEELPTSSLKRPSQVDYHRWVQGLVDTVTSGQKKRRRHSSGPESAGQAVEALVLRSPEEMDAQLIDSICSEGDAVTDSGLDQGAYLAMMKKRQELMDELVNTEKRYVEDLEIVLQNYFDDYDYVADSDVPAPLRGKKNIVFSNLDKICEFSKNAFLPALIANQKTPLKIASIVMEHERQLGLYSFYFKNMPAQEELLQTALHFYRSIQIRLNDPFTFQSYLIKPMQRMTKYRQFLESFQKYTPHTEGLEKFHQELKMAIWMVSFQLRHGNDLLALDRLKCAGLSTAEQGMLLRQGDMIVQDRKGRHYRRVFLFEEMVVLAKKVKPAKGANEGNFLCKDSVKLSDVGLTESVASHPHKFELFFRKHSGREGWLMTPLNQDRESSEELRAEWASDIHRLLWQQFQKVKERVQNVHVGFEGSLFGDKRASIIYGDHVSYASSSPGESRGTLSLRRPSVVSSENTSHGPVYAIPTRRPMAISGPLMQTSGNTQGPLYAISPPITASPSSNVASQPLPPIPADQPALSPTHPTRAPPAPPGSQPPADDGWSNPYAQLRASGVEHVYEKPIESTKNEPGYRGTIYDEVEDSDEEET